MQLSTPPVVLLLPLYHIQCFISIREFVERCHLINIFKGPCFSKYFKIKKRKSHYNCPRRPGQSSDKGAKLVNDKLKNLQQGQSDFIFLLQIFWNCFIFFIYPSERQTPNAPNAPYLEIRWSDPSGLSFASTNISNLRRIKSL